MSIETLRVRFDPKAMASADIYPAIWEHTTEDFDTYLAPYFPQLGSFYPETSASGRAELLALS